MENRSFEFWDKYRTLFYGFLILIIFRGVEAKSFNLTQGLLKKACVAGDRLFEETTIDSSVTFYKIQYSPRASVVDEHQIQYIYQILAHQRHIPFRRDRQGCEARALEMALVLDKMCLKSAKAFVRGPIYITSKRRKWALHVAPILLVKMNNGRSVPFVIDPTLFDKAVPLPDWAGLLGSLSSNSYEKALYITEQYIYLLGDIELNYTSYNPIDIVAMKKALKTLNGYYYGITSSIDEIIDYFHR